MRMLVNFESFFLLFKILPCLIYVSVGLDLGPSVRELCAANRSSEKQVMVNSSNMRFLVLGLYQQKWKADPILLIFFFLNLSENPHAANKSDS